MPGLEPGKKLLRAVVEADADVAVGVALVAEGVLNLEDVLGGGAGEEVGAHSDGDLAMAVDLVVLEDNLLPALATVDGEAGVLSIATLDVGVADEVGHGQGTRPPWWA